MLKYSSFIRQDPEFIHSVETVRAELTSAKPLPVVINGLTGGASDAYVAEAIGDILSKTESPMLVLVPSDEERRRICSMLASQGVAAEEFKPRELVFHNISASCDVDRERLSVLLGLMSGRVRPRHILRTSPVLPRAMIVGYSTIS